MSDELLARAAPYIGAPYRLRGRAPDGWDCWGCVRFLRAELFGRVSPDWSDAYTAMDGVTTSRLAEVMHRLVGERLAAWTPVPPRAGAVVLFSLFGRSAHCGLLLDDRHMIHALGGCGTAIEPIDRAPWASRLQGCHDSD